MFTMISDIIMTCVMTCINSALMFIMSNHNGIKCLSSLL